MITREQNDHLFKLASAWRRAAVLAERAVYKPDSTMDDVKTTGDAEFAACDAFIRGLGEVTDFHTAAVDKPHELTTICEDCGETMCRTVWSHANGLLICEAKGRIIAAAKAGRTP